MYKDAKGTKIFWPKKSHAGYFDKDLRVKFSSPKQKSEYLIKNGLYENAGAKNKVAHVEKLIDGINYDREKRGQPLMTKQQCVGNGVNQGKIRITSGVKYERGQWERIFKS